MAETEEEKRNDEYDLKRQNRWIDNEGCVYYIVDLPSAENATRSYTAEDCVYAITRIYITAQYSLQQ